jgi:STE24 endopeptidase
MNNRKFLSRLFSKTKELGPWWDVRKVGFKKRLLIMSVVVMSTTFYVVFHYSLLGLISLLVFLVFAELFAFIYSPKYLSNLWLTFTHYKLSRIPVPIEITDLSKRMDVQIKELKIKEKFCSAYVIGKSLVLGKGLLDLLDIPEALAVVAHELGHIKEKHSLIRFLLVPICLLNAWSWRGLPFQILFIASLAYVTVFMIPLNWILEYRADRIAKEFAGSKNLESALLKLASANEIDLDEPSEGHPAISKRLKLIRELES